MIYPYSALRNSKFHNFQKVVQPFQGLVTFMAWDQIVGQGGKCTALLGAILEPSPVFLVMLVDKPMVVGYMRLQLIELQPDILGRSRGFRVC